MWRFVASDGDGLNSLEALGKSALEESLAGVTTLADWKTQPSTVTLVITYSHGSHRLQSC